MTTQPKITPADAGTWLDGSQGWTNSYRVIDRAVAYGMAIDPDDDMIRDAYADGADSVTLSTGEVLDAGSIGEAISGQGELSDRATEYLESMAPDGYTFLWDTGELSLTAITWRCRQCTFELSAVGEETAERMHDTGDLHKLDGYTEHDAALETVEYY
jgi:hypothetical protein